jgi:putative peptide zinc metalloprotease protein
VLRKPSRLQPLDVWTARDLRVARWYAPFFAVGVGVMLAVWILALIPVMTGLVRMAVESLTDDPSGTRFWDAALFITLNVVQISFFAYLALRNRAQARRVPGRSHRRSQEEH